MYAAWRQRRPRGRRRAPASRSAGAAAAMVVPEVTTSSTSKTSRPATMPVARIVGPFRRAAEAAAGLRRPRAADAAGADTARGVWPRRRRASSSAWSKPRAGAAGPPWWAPTSPAPHREQRRPSPPPAALEPARSVAVLEPGDDLACPCPRTRGRPARCRGRGTASGPCGGAGSSAAQRAQTPRSGRLHMGQRSMRSTSGH